MKLTANITLDELCKSQVSERKGINNNPNPQQIENIKALAVNVLQPIRSHFDKPLIISRDFVVQNYVLQSEAVLIVNMLQTMEQPQQTLKYLV